MFGLDSGSKTKKPGEELTFELEKELMNFQKHREILKRIEQRIHKIKDLLRTGEYSQEFAKLGALLQGYIALLKVMSRFKPKA
jgi:negative regulator of replication initiation